jgi:predicted house-cleaning NTP pyrophosphatase (Maf/HAM1 superfamily)
MAKQPAKKEAAKKTAKAAAKKAPAKKKSKASDAVALDKDQIAAIDKHIGEKEPQHMVHSLAELISDRPSEILQKLQMMKAKAAYFPEIIEALEIIGEDTAGAES